ncbi:MAG: UTP--glucose-1-phosphate uridylyltransferase, partial [Kiritimatiellae bacterium]|nr:UTP--glucose-1-phosphate uridylyltransferase [Kiritimatiellia bacterium]
MKYEEAVSKLEKCGQEHVLRHWKKLGKKERESLLAQIEALDPAGLRQCREALAAGATPPDASKGLAAKVERLAGKKRAAAVAAGEAELRAGRVAALLVAGGQGSRLGFEGPKGAYPIGPLTGAPLFYFHARKILARSRRYGRPIPFYVMTSEANNAATVECFEKNGWFGLDRKNVFFFTQGMWPGMTADGKIILDAPGHIFTSPDGHGGLLAAMKRAGVLADMKKRGVESVFF